MKEEGFWSTFYRMDTKEQFKWMLVLSLCLIVACGTGFHIGYHGGYNRGVLYATNACEKVLPPPCPDVQCPEEPACIYNDGQSVKMIRFVHKDGRVCYGIKPYGKEKIVAVHCPPEQ
jgi:hypothetical protein